MPSFCLAAGLAVFLIVSSSLRAAELTIFAAASLTDVLTEIAPAYESASGDQLRFNFAGSNVLCRQIQEGAPADVFVSADTAKMETLAQEGLLQAGSERTLLSNTLVIVVPADSPLAFDSVAGLDRPEVKRLALADPQGVPAGIYAKTLLEKHGLWTTLQAKVIPTENVRAALAAVAAGNAEAGIVYKTDAVISREVKVAYDVPAAEGPVISYPAAVLKSSSQSAPANRFLAYLQSEPARQVFRREGFLIAP